MTQLEVLALYFAHGVEVKHRDTGKGHELQCLGRTSPYWPFGYAYLDLATLCPLADESGPVVLPVLYDFADLATPLTLPSGEVVVPAVEVAKMMAPGCDNWLPLTTTMPREDETEVFNAKGWREFNLYAHQVERLPAVVADYLRSLHFAVGLPADSWVRKEVARA
jgi:hypothetical protein